MRPGLGAQPARRAWRSALIPSSLSSFSRRTEKDDSNNNSSLQVSVSGFLSVSRALASRGRRNEAVWPLSAAGGRARGRGWHCALGPCTSTLLPSPAASAAAGGLILEGKRRCGVPVRCKMGKEWGWALGSASGAQKGEAHQWGQLRLRTRTWCVPRARHHIPVGSLVKVPVPKQEPLAALFYVVFFFPRDRSENVFTPHVSKKTLHPELLRSVLCTRVL